MSLDNDGHVNQMLPVKKSTACERIGSMGTKKKIVYTFLAVCFMWIVQPETAAAAGEIKVKGIDILQEQDHTVQCGSGTAKYEPDTNTLTLNQAVIADNGNALAFGIEIGKEGVTVELVGQNTIDAHIGISSESPLHIKGTNGGSLAIHAHTNQSLGTNACCGIKVHGGGLTVQDADIQIRVSDLNAAVGGSNTVVSGYAIDICGGENRISNSNIVIDMPNNFDIDERCTGINATDAVSLTISDNSSVTMNSVDAGIGMYGGKLVISGSRLTIANADQYGVSCKSVEILNGSDVSVLANRYSALQANDNMTISNSTVNAESEKNNSIICQNLAATDSAKLTAKGYWPALFAVKGSVIKDSVVDAESSADVGIFCEGGNMEIAGSEVKSTSGNSNLGGILIKGNLTMTDSNIISPGSAGVNGIRATGDISVTGGSIEIGEGKISSGNQMIIGGTITSNGVPSYDNVESGQSGGQVTFLGADYSAVDEAIAKAEALKKADYTNFDAVEAAVNAVVRGKDIREQAIVDGYAAEIQAAIAALKPVEKPEEPGEKPEDPGEKPEEPGEKPDDPAEKPEDPVDKPEEKPEKPGGKPTGKPDGSSNETGQKPSVNPSQDQTQNPAQTPTQNQGDGEKSPKTGDNIPLLGWLTVLAVISAAGISVGKLWKR